MVLYAQLDPAYGCPHLEGPTCSIYMPLESPTGTRQSVLKVSSWLTPSGKLHSAYALRYPPAAGTALQQTATHVTYDIRV